MDHSAQVPISTIDFPSPEALMKAASRVQRGMIHSLLEDASPEMQGFKKFELVQKGFVPSKREIAASLLAGNYSEYL